MTRHDHLKVIVAGFGSADRGDDGVGAIVAREVAARDAATCEIGPLSEPLDLLDYCEGADLVVVVDAVRSQTTPGTIRVIEMDVVNRGHDVESFGAGDGSTSTHGIGLIGVLRVAKAIGRAPRRLVVVGIEGECFALGDDVSPRVRAAVPEAVRQVLELIAGVHVCA